MAIRRDTRPPLWGRLLPAALSPSTTNGAPGGRASESPHVAGIAAPERSSEVPDLE